MRGSARATSCSSVLRPNLARAATVHNDMVQSQFEVVQESASEDEAQRSGATTAAVIQVDAESHVLSDDAIASARMTVTSEAQRHQRIAGIVVGALTVLTVATTAIVQWMVRRYGEDADFWRVTFPILTATNLSLLLTLSGGLLWNRAKRGRCIRAQIPVLSTDGDRESIGALIDLFKFDDLYAHKAAKRSLTELLPNLRANDVHLLHSRHRTVLNRILGSLPEEIGRKDIRELFCDTSAREAAFRVAILEGYQQIGEADALPIVERLANMDATTNGQRSIKEAAIECLPYLRIRVEQQTAHGSLLRGSSATSVSGESLLRPASASYTAPSDELLRPGEAAVPG